MLRRPNPEIPLGFLLASLFWIAVLGSQSSYSLTDGEKQQCYEEAKKTGYKSEECKSFWERTTSDPVAFFTFTLTVVTLALGAISIRQFHYLKRSDATARIAAEAARNSANALISAERAHLFVAVDGNSIGEIVSTYRRWDKSESMFSQDVETPSVAYSFRNFGKTHAIIKELSNQIIAAAEFLKVAEFTIREVMPDELVIAPNSQSAIMTCLMQDTFNVGGAVDFQKRKVAFWFYGYVVFDDTFGSEHRFEFRFCYRRGYGGPRQNIIANSRPRKALRSVTRGGGPHRAAFREVPFWTIVCGGAFSASEMVGLPLTTAANAAKLSRKSLISLAGAP